MVEIGWSSIGRVLEKFGGGHVKVAQDFLSVVVDGVWCVFARRIRWRMPFSWKNSLEVGF